MPAAAAADPISASTPVLPRPRLTRAPRLLMWLLLALLTLAPTLASAQTQNGQVMVGGVNTNPVPASQNYTPQYSSGWYLYYVGGSGPTSFSSSSNPAGWNVQGNGNPTTSLTITNTTGTSLLGFQLIATYRAAGQSQEQKVYFTTTRGPTWPAPYLASAVGSGTGITLTWFADEAAGVAAYDSESYLVERSASSTGPYAVVGSIYAAGNPTYSLTDSNIAGGTTYYYVIVASDSAGDGPNSNQVGTAALPAAPTGLIVQALATNAQVSLSWFDPFGATGYNVYRSATSGGGYVKVGSTSGTNFTDVAVVNGNTYYYVVTAVNVSGEGPPSNQVSATPSGPAPVAVTGLTATAGDSQVQLTWPSVPGADGYNIYRGTVSGGEGAVPLRAGYLPSGQATNTFTDTAVTLGQTYYYQVTAFIPNLEGGRSNEASATPGPLVAINCNGPAVGWFAADEDYSGGGTWYTGAAVNTTNVVDPAPAAVYQTARFQQFQYTLPGLTPGVGYTVRLHFAENFMNGPGQRQFDVFINGVQVLNNYDVYAAAGGQNVALIREFPATANASGQIVVAFVNGLHDNPFLNGIELNRRPAPGLGVAPGTPTLTATAGPGSVSLNWTTVNGAVSYNVIETSPSYGPVLNTAATTAILPGLTPGIPYTYMVAAVDGSGTGLASNPATATPSATQPAPVELLQINAGGGAAYPYVADTDFSGGNTASTGAAIDTYGVVDPAPQAVYQTERWGNFTYTLPGLTPGAPCIVRLHFAEIFHGPGLPGGGGVGSRQFNVAINGQPVLNNFDIFAMAGGPNIAIVESFPATVNAAGQIVVAFTNGAADNAKVDGLEVWATPPAAPTGLTATPGNATVFLAWDGVGGATGYNVYRATGSGVPAPLVSGSPRLAVVGGRYVKINVSPVTSTLYTDTGLTNGTTYSYYVTALSAGGESAPSNIASATPSLPPPPSIVSVTASPNPVTSTTTTLGVSTSGGAAPLAYAWSTAAGDPAGVTYSANGTGGASTTTATFTRAGVYHFTVTVTDAAGRNASGVVTVTVSQTPTSISVSPANVTVAPLSSVQFSATVLDQFGNAMATQPSIVWTAPAAAGAISASGLFTSTNLVGGPYPVTAASGSISGSANVTVGGVAAPDDLSVYATGSSQVTLYWSGVPNVVGYNVYRGTSPSGENYASPINGAVPITTTDGNPGVNNVYVFTDQGLTSGSEYFYTVEAVTSTAQSAPSNEDSDIPNSSAIPWTGTATSILNAFHQTEPTPPGLQYSLSYASLRVMGPDGTIYQDGISSPSPPDGSIDPVGGNMTLGNEIVPTAPFLYEASASFGATGKGISANSMTASPADLGGMRRVLSSSGINSQPFTGSAGTFYLPSTSDSTYLQINDPEGIREGPHAYLGLTSAAVQVDAGIYYSLPLPANNLPARWEAFLRISDGWHPTNRSTAGYVKNLRVMADHSLTSYIYAPSQIGNIAALSFAVNPQHHTCDLVVFGSDVNGLYFGRWYIATGSNIKLNSKAPLAGLLMKRLVTLAQNVPASVAYVAFPPQPKNTTPGYVATGSYLDSITWSAGSLYQNGQQYDWSITDNTYTGLTYVSPNIVTLTPGTNDPTSETISIHF